MNSPDSQKSRPCPPLDGEALEREAAFFYRTLFGGEVSADICQRYTEAHHHYGLWPDRGQETTVCRVIRGGLDAEAVEVSLRQHVDWHLLTRKMRVIIYLAETSGWHDTVFLNRECRPLTAYWALFFGGLRTGYKRVKGRYLVWRYDLV